MVFETLIGGGAPFITGIVIFLGLVIGMFLLRLPLEFAVLITVPVIMGIVAYYIPALTPITAIIIGIIIGFMFLKIVRR